MKIDQIEPENNITELIVRVVSVGPARIIKTRSGRKTQLREVLVGDETGTVILTLWGFREGSELTADKVIKITDGWAKEWQGKIQISLGRSGKLEVIDDDGSLPQITDILPSKSRMDEEKLF